MAFKPFDGEEWKKVTVTNPDTGRYVHKDETMRPSTAFQVKVKAFNNKGDGPYSLTAVINSAQDGEQKAHGLDEGATRASREAFALLPFGPY